MSDPTQLATEVVKVHERMSCTPSEARPVDAA
jgi:hypothetical protein